MILPLSISLTFKFLRRRPKGSIQICTSISHNKKEETVAMVKKLLEGSHLVVKIKLKSLLNGYKKKNLRDSLTSFDWNEVDRHCVGTSIIDT